MNRSVVRLRVVFIAMLGCLLLSAAAVAETRSAKCAPARRGVHVNSQAAVAVNTDVAVVPFAVPVAVPVATVQQPTLLYSFRALAQAYEGTVCGEHACSCESCSPEVPEVEPAVSDLPSSAELARETIAQRCATCHSRDEHKGDLVLEGVVLEELDRPLRLETLRRITTPDADRRMPKDGELSPAELDALIDVLVR